MAEDKQERRGAPRARTVRAAISVFTGPDSPIPCVVLDLSDTGARINLPGGEPLPEEFLLAIESKQIERRCRIAWRSGDEIGVEFTS
jgi:hypothetical protein